MIDRKWLQRSLCGFIVVGFVLAVVFAATSSASAAVTWRSSASASTGGATTIAINAPAGSVAGDVLVASIVARHSGTAGFAITAPTGFMLLQTVATGSTNADIVHETYYLVLTSAPDASYTWTFNASVKSVGSINAYAGADVAAPIDASAAQANVSSTSKTAPSISPTAAGGYLIGTWGVPGLDALTVPADMVERNAISATGGNGATRATLSVADKEITVTGATGDKIATGAASVSTGHLIALKPAPVINTPPSSPTPSSPASGATGVSTNPTLSFKSTDAENDYLRYRIDVCSTSDCSAIVRTIDQTASQTGWTGQDAEAGTAYIGSSTLTSSTLASHSYQAPALNNSTQYWWRAYAVDPAGANTFSGASTISSFTTVAPANNAPSAPTLSLPANSATSISITPQFQLRSSDAENDYLRYRIEVCSTSNCSAIVSTIDQTASQTGWTGQDTQTGTAYIGSSTLASSTLASNNYQAPALNNSTQYWWRAFAVDPGGSNTFSTSSTISSFTTAAPGPINQTELRGGTTIRGGTRFGN